MSWWSTWKQYSMSAGTDPPESIDSEDILIDEGSYTEDPANDYTRNVVKSGLTCEVDYTLVTPEVWALLKEKYGVKSGRSEIERFSVMNSEVDTIVEVTLRPVRFVMVPPRGQSSSTLRRTMTTYTSSKAAMSDVRDKLLRIQNNEESKMP
jgi:hypothetical protein